MTFQRDLIRNSIPYSCSQCVWRSCKKCKGFIPDNMDAFLSVLVERFKTTLPNAKGRKLIRRATLGKGLTMDGITTLDTYYVGLINDSLDALRTDSVAYVFTLGQVKDIMMFEKDINLRYDDGVYEITLSNINC